jgi:serine/threonine protein kinase
MTRSDAKSEAASGIARRSDLARPLRRVGEWDLVRLVGEGSLTEVYRARPAGSAADRPAAYALKMLRAQWQRDPKAIELLRREALVGRQVAHPHLIAILAAGLVRPPYFVVMPWLEGRTLAKRLAGRVGIDVPVALWIGRQVAEALDALHAAGWTHGDVKPTNIFISPEGHVTLLDLGFARRGEETGSAVDRCVMGTCSYMAPEMITSALGADIRSDIYSLGVVLYEAFSGRLPFAGSDLGELASQHRQARPPDLRRLVPQLPRGVTRLVHQMLAKVPLRRPQAPAELIERLVALEIETFAERAIE